ncbi:uncharacterized protein LOC112567923 isoform X2 [Pomacea canaliculata]|uniref:uncharacterized protein LOC112567923 isoform X2 n=1 Tax=Pomacea canaliculata TaxID=400727 RepID=UPI000D73BB25|nr:uncharacterized protein LOC112567923 isoform X2 [Pomacea canaliculata]
MKVLYQCLILISVATTEIAESKCVTTDERNLECQFPKADNSTHKTFTLIFYPDSGGEELLVECVWTGSKFHCITQKSFEVREPISDTAVITIPRNFSDQKGSYRCISENYTLDSIMPCWFPETQDSKHFATCEVNSEFSIRQVMLKCIFSSSIEGFSVIYNNTLVARYTQSSCQNSTPCHHIREDNKYVFIVKLNTSQYENSEYLCLPDNGPVTFEVKGCSVAMEKHTEAQASWKVNLTIILPIIGVMLLVLGLSLFIRRKRQVRRYQPQPLSTDDSASSLV